MKAPRYRIRDKKRKAAKLAAAKVSGPTALLQWWRSYAEHLEYKRDRMRQEFGELDSRTKLFFDVEKSNALQQIALLETQDKKPSLV